jgi:hypothetical protein
MDMNFRYKNLEISFQKEFILNFKSCTIFVINNYAQPSLHFPFDENLIDFQCRNPLVLMQLSIKKR